MSEKLKKFENEVELKEFLDENGMRYGDTMISPYAYVVYFRDNKGGTNLVRGIYNTPIEAIRSIQTIQEKTHLPVEDIDILLVGALNQMENEYTKLNCLLSPYIYFKTPEETEAEKKAQA